MVPPETNDDVFPLVPAEPALPPPPDAARFNSPALVGENAPHCPGCDYNLYGISEPRCPECGLDLTAADVFVSRAAQLDQRANERVMRRQRRLFWAGMAGYPLGMLFYYRSSPEALAFAAITFGALTIVAIMLRASQGHAVMPVLSACGGIWLGLHAATWILRVTC